MCILHQYHKASGLKACTTMCRSKKWKWGNMFKMAGDRFVVHFSSAVWGGGGDCCRVIIWNNYVEIHRKSMQVIFCAPENIILSDPTRQHEVWKKILLQADPIERQHASWRWTQNKTQLFNVSLSDQILTRKWPKWNYTANMIMIVLRIVCHLILYFPVN